MNLLEILTKIDQKMVSYLIYIAVFLIGMDMVTTAAGLNNGLEESNGAALLLMNRFGDLFGLSISVIGKSILVISPMIAYEYTKKCDEFIKRFYWFLYALFVLIAIITTLNTDIKNLMLIY